MVHKYTRPNNGTKHFQIGCKSWRLLPQFTLRFLARSFILKYCWQIVLVLTQILNPPFHSQNKKWNKAKNTHAQRLPREGTWQHPDIISFFPSTLSYYLFSGSPQASLVWIFCSLPLHGRQMGNLQELHCTLVAAPGGLCEPPPFLL